MFSNNPEAPGLAYAREAGIDALSLSHRGFADRAEFDGAVIDVLDDWGVDWVVLAGYMRILSPAFIQRFDGRIVNIHPSLLPSFPGLHPHEKAIARGVRVSGVTVHLVAPGAVDDGPIVAQQAVPVLPDDDPDQLAARILAVEHEIYAASLHRLFSGELVLRGDRVENA